MILYACDHCPPEESGYHDPCDVRVMPDGKWLCDNCYSEEAPDDATDWRTLPKPSRYGDERLRSLLLKHGHHTNDCRWRGGHDCDCGWDEIKG